MLVDIYTHVYPQRYFDELLLRAPALEDMGKRLRSVRKLLDLDMRFREMDEYGDYRQIISLPNPPIEDIATGRLGNELATIANDSLAELCSAHPDRFPAFVAAINLHEVDTAVREAERARDCGACGFQIFTNVAGKPLDGGDYEDVFAFAAEHDLPIWLHPARTAKTPDYASEEKSRFEMWWCFGWPYETSVAMCRLVFSGLFDRYPGLKIITHHLGGMIPYFDGRVDSGLQVLGARTTGEDYSRVLPSLRRPHIEYLREFYADTALFGGQHGLRCGLDFFGSSRLVFASDAPFGPIGSTRDRLLELGLSQKDYEDITFRNAERLLGRTLSPQRPSQPSAIGELNTPA
jgi:uncharacterized protein